MSSEEIETENWRITIDAMMIIGKYFEENRDYVNVMRVCKRYRDLVQMYHFNPIRDCELFENMETQYLYLKEDKKKEGFMFYVYWYLVDYGMVKNKRKNEEYKRVILNGHKELNIEDGKCILPEEITLIGDDCFHNCGTLTSVHLPSKLRSIGNDAFRDTHISTITIPEGVTAIGYNCFLNVHH